MSVNYETTKDIPCEQLHQLFIAVGWSDGTETANMINNFNLPFLNSTVVVTAWADNNLVGCVRVLSDQMFRSVIYDLAVAPAFQNQGIGKELVRRCTGYYPDSEWLVGTTPKLAGYYEGMGFKTVEEVYLSIPSKWF
ncbi:GNAT family N-acetyltransferase [Paenibacillus tepidiphilus]|uniref:GNAT family N-acetyltransferase n=1 Tax=Paenibacillus tepidiphilus TaxID=2608683 RepID=UPI00123B5875|nr:GNAT family N-acetyltransferase [Paenibacillus tepidiphilus]